MLLLNGDRIVTVRNVLVDGGYTGERFGGLGVSDTGSDRGSRLAQRATPICCDSEALGRRAFLCLAGEMPATTAVPIQR